MFSAGDAVTTSQPTSSSLRLSGWWMPPSRPPSDAGNGNLISSLSTCIVGLQRRRDRPGSREERTRIDHDSLHSSVTGGPDSHEVAPDANRPSEQDKLWESTFPSTTPPPTDRNRRPMPPEDQNYAVYFRPFPQPGSSAVFSMSWRSPLPARMLGKFWKRSLARAPSITTLAVDRVPPLGGEVAIVTTSPPSVSSGAISHLELIVSFDILVHVSNRELSSRTDLYRVGMYRVFLTA